MAILRKPIPSAWYVSRVGKLMTVRLLLFSRGCLSHVLLEYPDGVRNTLSVAEWNALDLVMYSQGRRRGFRWGADQSN